MRYLIMLIAFLSLSWTASSQITGIPEETKREIVMTLLDYPLVLKELELAGEKNQKLIEATDLLKEKSDVKDNIIDNQGNEIENLLEQKRLYDKELKRRRSYGFIYLETNVNGFNSYTGGLDYVFKSVVIIGPSLSYDNLYKHFNVNVKFGIKIF